MSSRLHSRVREASRASSARRRGYAALVVGYWGAMDRATPAERPAIHGAFVAEFAEAMKDPAFARGARALTEECMKDPEWVAWMEEHKDDDVTQDSTWEMEG